MTKQKFFRILLVVMVVSSLCVVAASAADFGSEDYQSNITGLYPPGEGAGYAGGIMSAAVDGVRVAQYICEKYRPAY